MAAKFDLLVYACDKNSSWLMAHRSWQVPQPRTMWYDFDLQATKSRETWCYAGTHFDLKEKRPGFMFVDGKNKLIADGSSLMASAQTPNYVDIL